MDANPRSLLHISPCNPTAWKASAHRMYPRYIAHRIPDERPRCARADPAPARLRGPDDLRPVQVHPLHLQPRRPRERHGQRHSPRAHPSVRDTRVHARTRVHRTDAHTDARTLVSARVPAHSSPRTTTVRGTLPPAQPHTHTHTFALSHAVCARAR
eukprot:5987784-Pleurochrysis_carterae.AAC.1